MITRPSPDLPAGPAPPTLPVAPPQATTAPVPVQPSPAYSLVSLRYTETAPILVNGPATGRTYRFSGSNPVQAVDRRDVAALLRTCFFRPG